MPEQPTYPGVYIEELPSAVRTIIGVATSITAFVGRAKMGPVNDPIRIQSLAEFDRVFGGLSVDSTMSYAVRHYFLNGGKDALVVRVVPNDAEKASITLPASGSGGSGSSDAGGTGQGTGAGATPSSGDAGGTGSGAAATSSSDLVLEAASEGEWGSHLQARVDYETSDEGPDSVLFNLTIRNAMTEELETLRNLSVDPSHARFVKLVLEEESNFVRATDVPQTRPDAHPDPSESDPFPHTAATGGSDGSQLSDSNIQGNRQDKSGIFALEKADIFNLLCLPPLTHETDFTDAKAVYDGALNYCKERRAMLLVDPPRTWDSVADAADNVGDVVTRDENAAIFFPRLIMADPLKDNQAGEFVPCGAVAGIFARTDATRGVWKAPAGQEATIRGVRRLAVKMTDGENGQINPLGINALRSFPVTGHVVWGARTLEGADRLASQWKYIPVRRLALFIEESLYRGTQWVVFEPNDEPLWAQIRLNVGAFMHNLFRQGAFQGSTPREAYLVKCDSETTTQNDIDRGIVNILVGFAPLKPAEFVFIKIQQLAGQIEA